MRVKIPYRRVDGRNQSLGGPDGRSVDTHLKVRYDPSNHDGQRGYDKLLMRYVNDKKNSGEVGGVRKLYTET